MPVYPRGLVGPGLLALVWASPGCFRAAPLPTPPVPTPKQQAEIVRMVGEAEDKVALRRTAFRPIATTDQLFGAYRPMDIRDTAIDALARIGTAAVAPLVQTLSDRDPLMRISAARALASIGPDARDAVPALVQALGDPDQGVRNAAARALGQIGPAAAGAVPALLELLRDESVRAAREASDRGAPALP